jgi:hypothetical protein
MLVITTSLRAADGKTSMRPNAACLQQRLLPPLAREGDSLGESHTLAAPDAS